MTSRLCNERAVSPVLRGSLSDSGNKSDSKWYNCIQERGTIRLLCTRVRGWLVNRSKPYGPLFSLFREKMGRLRRNATVSHNWVERKRGRKLERKKVN